MRQLGELILAITIDWFFLLGINFCNSQKVPSTQHPALIIFSFLLSTCIRNKHVAILRYPYPMKPMRQIVIGQTRLLSTVFLCSDLKPENIYFGVNFCRKNVCGNFYLRELIFAKKKIWKNRKNFNPQKFRATRYTTCVITSHADVLRGSSRVNVSVGGYVLVRFCRDSEPRFRHAAFNRFLLSHFLS